MAPGPVDPGDRGMICGGDRADLEERSGEVAWSVRCACPGGLGGLGHGGAASRRQQATSPSAAVISHIGAAAGDDLASHCRQKPTANREREPSHTAGIGVLVFPTRDSRDAGGF